MVITISIIPSKGVNYFNAVLFQEVHKEVPYQVERRVCPGDADWDDVRDTAGGSFSPSVIADAFNQVIIKG